MAKKDDGEAQEVKVLGSKKLYKGKTLKYLERISAVHFDPPDIDPKWTAALKEAVSRANGRGGCLEYNPDFYPECAYQMSVRAFSHRMMGAVFGVSSFVIRYWSDNHTRFRQALFQGRIDCAEEVENAAFRRATGYDVDTVTVQVTEGLTTKGKRTKTKTTTHSSSHVPPNPTSFMFYLCNRFPAKWRSIKRRELEDADGEAPEGMEDMQELTDEKLRTLIGSLQGELDKGELAKQKQLEKKETKKKDE